MNGSWRRFRGDKPALFGATVIAIAVTSAVFAPVVAPYDPARQFFEGLTLEGAPKPPLWLQPGNRARSPAAAPA